MPTIANTSGIEALEYNVLVKPPKQEDHTFTDPVTGKKFQLHKPDEYKDREQVSATTGTVVDVSPSAFSFIEDCPSVSVGDQVVFPRHNAMIVDGEDGEKYFILKDKTIAGVFRGQK